MLLAVMWLCETALSPANANDKMSDDEIRRALVGSWIVPPDSSDRTEENGRSVELFRSDGTYTAYIYADRACTELAKQMEVRWFVENGVLSSALPGSGSVVQVMSRDEVINIQNGVMTLHSLDDGSTYTRVKAKTCGIEKI